MAISEIFTLKKLRLHLRLGKQINRQNSVLNKLINKVGSEYYRCKEKVKKNLENKKSYLLTEFVFNKWESKNNNLLT